MEPQNIKWSYSGLKDYINCPKQYAEVKVYKRFTKTFTPQILYGNAVHKALEHYVKDGTPLAENYLRFKNMLDTIISMEGDKYPELRMALTYDKLPCTFGASDFWVRGIVDLITINGDTAYIIDYKTGSNKYPDPKQLQLMALMAFEHFPKVNHIRAGLLFVMHDHFVDSEYHRANKEALWKDFANDLERLRLSHETDVWQANPTPLCGWCPVKTCEFQKER